MDATYVHLLQHECLSAYERAPQEQAAACAQAIASLEIALQLSQLNEKLERITTEVERWSANGVPVERVP